MMIESSPHKPMIGTLSDVINKMLSWKNKVIWSSYGALQSYVREQFESESST